MNCKKIRDQRRRAELSLAVVAAAVNRTKGWLSKVENGLIAVDAKTAHKISAAIERLKNLRAMQETSWNFDDVKLPDAKNRRTV